MFIKAVKRNPDKDVRSFRGVFVRGRLVRRRLLDRPEDCASRGLPQQQRPLRRAHQALSEDHHPRRQLCQRPQAPVHL